LARRSVSAGIVYPFGSGYCRDGQGSRRGGSSGSWRRLRVSSTRRAPVTWSHESQDRDGSGAPGGRDSMKTASAAWQASSKAGLAMTFCHSAIAGLALKSSFAVRISQYQRTALLSCSPRRFLRGRPRFA
jgi:hypothetical protein